MRSRHSTLALVALGSLLFCVDGAWAAPADQPAGDAEAPSKNALSTKKAPSKKAPSKKAPSKKASTKKASTKKASSKKFYGRHAGIRYLRQPLRIGMSWDFQYEQGFVLNDPGPFSKRWFGRVRAGVLLVKEPWILAMGAVMEGAGLPSLAWGLQVEVTHLWRGMWAQATVSMDGGANMFSALSAGFSLLGFEWQRRLSGDGGVKNGYLLKLRIPVGIALFLR